MAKKLNTTQIGDELELKAFGLFGKLLADDRFFVPGKTSQIFHKKAYTSKERGEIIFDLSIETKLPGQEKYSILTLFECKNYSHAVQVEKIEAFSDRVRQVGGHKGIMVSQTSFQSGVIRIAKSRNIGLVRIGSANEIEWINLRKDLKDLQGGVDDIDAALSNENDFNSPLLGTVDGYNFSSFPDLFQFLGIIDQYYPPVSELSIPFKSDDEIEQRINELRFGSCYDHYKLNIQRFCEAVSELYDADFEFDQFPETLLNRTTIGLINYNPLKVSINPSVIKESPRWRFTVAHEIGHVVLHSRYLKEYFHQNAENEELQMVATGVPKEIYNRMEIQANKFAASVLMPEGVFLKVVKNYFQRESISKGFIYWDHQAQNRKLAMDLLSELELLFGVSKEAAKIRLKQFGLLKGTFVNESAGDHLRAMGYGPRNFK